MRLPRSTFRLPPSTCRVRGEEEARRKLKRRKKRRREKASRKAQKLSAAGAAGSKGEESSDEEGAEAEEDEDVIRASDELEPLMVVATKSKIRGCAFAPAAVVAGKRKGALKSGASEGSPVAQLALSLTNNAVEVVDVRMSEAQGDAASVGTSEVVQRIELGGHRSDVRCCALSSDDQLLATASNTAMKVGRL